jgi:uncharacterized membrane protein YphA (DoxX/SURF4 family)
LSRASREAPIQPNAFEPSGGGWGDPNFAPRAVESAAAEATRSDFADSSTKEVVWRARVDGTLELARRHSARVELYTVSRDGTPQLVATSERSRRAIVAAVCACGGFGVGGGIWLAVGGKSWAFALAIGLFVLCGVLAGHIDGGSLVRTWLRERFGTDEDWVVVPHRFEGEPATGNQLIAIGGLADARGERAVFRMLHNGVAEVATERDGAIEVYAVDAVGGVALVDRLDLRSLGKVCKVRGERSEWHRVETKVETGD